MDNFLWIKHLNVRPESVKCPRGKHWGKLRVIGLENGFLDLITTGTDNKSKSNQWDCIKLKFLPNKGNSQQNEKVT